RNELMALHLTEADGVISAEWVCYPAAATWENVVKRTSPEIPFVAEDFSDILLHASFGDDVERWRQLGEVPHPETRQLSRGAPGDLNLGFNVQTGEIIEAVAKYLCHGGTTIETIQPNCEAKPFIEELLSGI